METINIVLAIILYFALPILVIFGVIVLIRRKRQKDAGRYESIKNKPLEKDDIRSVKADEAREARKEKDPPKNIDPETGRRPDQ